MAGEAGLAGRQPACPSQPRGPASCPQRPGSSVGLRAGGKEGLSSHPAARAKPLLFCDMEGAGSRSAACTMAGGPASVGLRARAHGSAAGKRSLALQRQPRGLRGARASLPSPDLLNPSFRVGQVGRGSWALAFGSRWRGGHPAACPAPGRLRAAQLGRPRGRSVVCGLRLSLSPSRGEGENQSPRRRRGGLQGAVCAVASPPRSDLHSVPAVHPPGGRKVLNPTIESNHYLECFGLWSLLLVWAVPFSAVKTLPPR